VRDNTAAPLPPRAARGFSLLAEEYAEAGYATAAFVASSVLDPRYGLDAGFEEYRHPAPAPPGDPTFPSRDASEQIELFRRWFEARDPSRPYFAWVHLWEPHAPYRPYAGDERRAGTDGDRDAPPVLYRGEVRKADAAVEALLGRIDRQDTVVVVTADHGESLGEHGESTHGYLCYGATMDVPLVLAGPGIAPGRRDDRVAVLEDLAPTLRRLSRLPPREGDGVDLRGRREPRVVAGESLYAYRLYTWAQQSCAFDGRYSLVDGGARVELFDRDRDPAERTPLADPASLAAYERLDRAIRAYQAPGAARQQGPAYSPAGTPYGSLRREEGDFLPPAVNRRLPDVRDNLPTVGSLNRLRAAIAGRDRALVGALLPQVVRLEVEDEGNPALSLALGRALLLVLERPAEAARALERAVERGYRSKEALRLLEGAYRAAGDEDNAARVAREMASRPGK
jgi:hypothetical protein